MGCLLLAIAKWMARRDMFLPRAIPKPRICAQRGLVTTRQSRGTLPTSRHPNIHCDTSQLVQHPGNLHFPRPGSADVFDVLSQPSIRRRLLTSRHPKKVANASHNMARTCRQDNVGHPGHSGQVEFVPLDLGPAAAVRGLRLLGEVQEQSLSNEGERGVRESERCRRG